jgi:hypothetical protein
MEKNEKNLLKYDHPTFEAGMYCRRLSKGFPCIESTYDGAPIRIRITKEKMGH